MRILPVTREVWYMKKFIEYGWIYAIENIEQDYLQLKLNFRNGLEMVAGLERYSKTDRLKYQQEMVRDCLNIAINECKDNKNGLIRDYIVKSLNLLKEYGL